MLCEHYKDALIESIASGTELSGAVRSHLDACPSCRASFAAEQQLFAAIDAGLHATANDEPSPAFLPRVRTALDEEVIGKRGWAPHWLVLAGAVAAIATFFVAQSVRRAHVDPASVNIATNTSSSERVTPPSPDQHPLVIPPIPGNLVLQPRASVGRNYAAHERQLGHNSVPEVLVPKDQEVLLARYAAQWLRRKRAPLLTEDSGEPAPAPLQIAPIQIAQLDVKLLAEEKSQ